MKLILSASIIHLIIVSYSAVSAELTSGKQEVKPTGTSKVDEVYLDELKTRKAGLQREVSEHKSGHIESKEDDQERQEEKKIEARQKSREGEAGGAEYDKKRVWR